MLPFQLPVIDYLHALTTLEDEAMLHLIETDPETGDTLDPMMTVRTYLRQVDPALTEPKLQVSERVAKELWNWLYGRPDPASRLRSRDTKYPLMFLEEIEDAMLGREPKASALGRIRSREYLKTMWELMEDVERIALLPNEVPKDYSLVKLDLEAFFKVAPRELLLEILKGCSPEIRSYGAASITISNYILGLHWPAVEALVRCAPVRPPLK